MECAPNTFNGVIQSVPTPDARVYVIEARDAAKAAKVAAAPVAAIGGAIGGFIGGNIGGAMAGAAGGYAFGDKHGQNIADAAEFVVLKARGVHEVRCKVCGVVYTTSKQPGDAEYELCPNHRGNGQQYQQGQAPPCNHGNAPSYYQAQARPCYEDQAPPYHQGAHPLQYYAGQSVQIWSESKRSWQYGVVTKVACDNSVSVQYGESSKVVPPEYQAQFLCHL